MAYLSCILKVITGIPFLVRTVRVYAIHSEKTVPSAGASQKVSNEYPDYKIIRKEYKFYSASYCKKQSVKL
jgi:hypothetical protein